MPIDSYQGYTATNLLKTYVEKQVNVTVSQMSQWSFRFRLASPITNGAQTISLQDLSKLSIYLTDVQGTTLNNQGLLPSLSNMGGITSPVPFSYLNSSIIPVATYQLQISPSSYFQMLLQFTVKAEPGIWMEPYSSWDNYRVNLIFEIFNSSGQLIDSKPLSYDMRIRPTDAPPGPSNSLTINPSAASVLMEFKTPGDYVNGVSVEKLNAISVESSSPYILEVRSLSSELASPSSTLPINTVQLQMRRSSTQQITGTANLSTAAQTLLSSPAHGESRNFDLLYKTTPPSIGSGFFNKPYETYSGTIVFSLTPQ